MTIRRPKLLRHLKKAQRKRAERRSGQMQPEKLEDRRLLATGPQLVGIQPNRGELLAEGQQRDEAPQDLTFLFNATAQLDALSLPTDEANPDKLDSIQIWRSGLDGEFETASGLSDFGTQGAVVVGFTAKQLGQGGNFLSIEVTKGSLGTNRRPLIDVVGKTIFVELNTRRDFETRASDLVAALNVHPTASQLIESRVLRGVADTLISTPTITYSPIRLTGANAATASSNFNAGFGFEVRFVAAQPGIDGNGISIHVTQADLGVNAPPQISVDGKRIDVTLNNRNVNNVDSRTTGAQLVAAINGHPRAGLLVNASIPVGNVNTVIGGLPINYSPLVLRGADDIRVVPGYLDLDASDPGGRKVIMRFKEPLVDDLYLINVFGSGPAPLTDIDGNAFQDGTDFQRTFELDLGAQVVAVVPQPVTRDANGRLQQARDRIVVYFNDDDLDPATAEDPSFYKLIYTNETVENTDDLTFSPIDIQYDAATDMAVLTFAQPLEELRDPKTGDRAEPGSFRLRIGTDEVAPLAPRQIDLTIDPGSSFFTARNLDVTGEWDTGDVLAVRAGGDQFAEGQLFTVTDIAGVPQKFEFDSGYLLQVPNAGANAAAGGIADGDTFTIANGPTSVTFEFNSDGALVDNTRTEIVFADGDSQALMAIKISDAITTAGLGLTPATLGSGRVHLGGTVNHTLNTSGSPLTQSGLPGAQTAGAIPVAFVPDGSFVDTQVAQSMADAINSAGFQVIATADATLVRLQQDKSIRLDSDFQSLDLSRQGVLLNAEIRNETPYLLDLPGSNDEAGHRDTRPEVETHLLDSADSNSGIETFYYNFSDEYGFLGGRVQRNVITESQKDRVREIFEFFSSYGGVQFIESANRGFTIVVGDMRVINPGATPNPGGLLGVAGNSMVIMDVQDFQTPDDNRFGGKFFQATMEQIGHLLGLGNSFELPELTIQGDEPILSFGQVVEPVFPGDHDIAHLQHLHRPESKDIDLYRFEVIETGVFTAETISERLVESSLLDTTLTLYKAQLDGQGRVTSREVVARNDDYYSTDSFIKMPLEPGIYYVGVSASGNDGYDPQIEDSGFGGRSEGNYQLKLDFRPDADKTIVDATGKSFDGDADGVQGGVYNYWFRAAAPQGVAAAGQPRTLFVDKSAPIGGTGSLAQPFNNLKPAQAAARPQDVVRVVGNAGADGDITTLDDNLAYEIGFSRVGNQALADGSTLEIPRDVSLMIDSGAILKVRRARIGVGSSSTGLDRSGGSLQVLGVPRVLDQFGDVRFDETGQPIVGSVYFTSIHDDEIGVDTNPDQTPPAPRAGDFGGIIFRQDVDQAANRLVYENEGIFLNYVNHADMRYGGGSLLINGITQVITPLHMIDARPTLTHNTIRLSADAAVSANPDSFAETNFHAPVYQQRTLFTSDYDRVGPEIHHNLVVENSINGLFIRIATPAGEEIEKLTVSGRWNDKDIAHVLSEALVIQGQPGGPLATDVAPPINLVTLSPQTGGTLDEGIYNYRVVFVDSQGIEGPASDVTVDQTLQTGEGTIQLGNLPTLRNVPNYVSRRLYRSDVTGGGRYTLVTELNGTDTSYIDDGTTAGGDLVPRVDVLQPRFNARLAIDPSIVVKLDGSRFESELGAELIAEGRDGQRVIFTSLQDRRYGAGGTFDTKFSGDTPTDPQPGDWAGLFLGHLSKASIDYATVAYAGGVTRLEGRFAAFNPIEIHQAEVRIAHSLFENNADGAEVGDVGGTLAPAHRFGRGFNTAATIFNRGAQPVIVDNVINFNEGPAISTNLNALNSIHVNDPGRVTGGVDVVGNFNENQGPLIRGNQMDSDPDAATRVINGLEVRPGTLTTQGVWDDADIVHVVFGTMYVPDFHTYGGLRIESQATQSLVVKLQGPDAGFTATGRPLEIHDRIGGSLQVIGQPRFPVVFTSLEDDSVGAGFTPEGRPQNDTNGDGAAGTSRFPTGPEVDNGNLIDNDVALGNLGHFSIRIDDGGSAGGAVTGFGTSGDITTQGNSGLQTVPDPIFEFFNFLDVGAAGAAIQLDQSTITTPATLVDRDRVVSRGTITGQNGTINWELTNWLNDGEAIVYNEIKLSSDTPLGDLRFINYLDEDIFFVSDDILTTSGTPGLNDFRAFTLDNPERVGFAHGGILEPGAGLENATYEGWAADEYNDQLIRIRGAGETFTVPGNIDTTSLPPFQDPELGLSYGPRDITSAFSWSIDPTATEATITSFLELVPRNPGIVGTPGDWRSIRLEEFSHDRNVEVAVEREASDLSDGPDNNQDPSNAQYVGALAPGEKAGDDNLRLGFEVHGVLASPGDVDVYSFDAQAGTEVWLDIDRTSQNLDTVVELVDANGGIIAQSDDSLREQDGALDLYADPTRLTQNATRRDLNPLKKSQAELYPVSAAGQPKDEYSINPRDAGMRVVLPGPQGTVNTYHVRVRSNNLLPGDARSKLLDLSQLNAGLTDGIYQLQIRLQERDEIPGSTIQFSDVRFATNGVELVGLPTHSPLGGEVVEDATNNQTFGNAQYMGNILASDRGALGISGFIDNLDNIAGVNGIDDVDWFQFDVDYLSTTNGGHAPLTIDVDYTDGLARPNTRISVFDANGNLVLHGIDSNIADDLPGTLSGVDLTDLLRGSAGTLDAFIGPVEFPEGTYSVAVTNDNLMPRDLQQYYVANPANPLVRLEPVNSVTRIADHDFDGGAGLHVATPPQTPVLFDNNSPIPFTLGDVTLFLARDPGGLSPQTQIVTVDPFTGERETTVGTFGFEVDDVAMRPDTDQLFGYTTWLDSPFQANDANSGNYILIDTGDGSAQNIGDDDIETYEIDPANGNEARSMNGQNQRTGVGYHFRAIDYQTVSGQMRGFAVGSRPPGFQNPPGPAYTENVLYWFDPTTGEAETLAFTPNTGDRQAPGRFVGAGTQVVERGELITLADPNDPANTALIADEATRVNGTTGATTFLINDGTRFGIDDDGDPLTPPVIFEFNSGPEVRLNPNPTAGNFLRDGDTFSLDGVPIEFDTGSVIVVNAPNGNFVSDGSLITITNNATNPVTRTFEFEKSGGTNPFNTPIVINNGMTQAQIVGSIVNAINGDFGLRITATSLGNRVTLEGESATVGATSTASQVVIQGQPGATFENVVHVEEIFDRNELGAAIRTDFAQIAQYRAGVDGARVNFSGAIGADFTTPVQRGVFQVVAGSDGSVNPPARGINFLAEDTGEEIAIRISNAMLAAGIGHTQTRQVINLAPPAVVEFANAPLQSGGQAPGGEITGMTFVDGNMYVVTDTGGLFRVFNYTTPLGAFTDYIETSAGDLLGIDFQGLTTLPQQTENRLYDNIMLGIDGNGTLYAFDTAGQLQPIFLDGQSSIETGVSNIVGLGFSQLQENLWSVTNARANDAGHGTNAAFDGSRGNSNGGNSLRFGSDYDWSGGAFGAVESNAFSLAGYSPEDKPYLYFNYFAETEGANGANMWDSFRVFVADESGDWDLLSTNNSSTPHELSLGPNNVKEEFDNTGGWRQVRVSLDNYAGLDNLKLRFDFSTAGERNYGDDFTTGSDLRIIEAARLRDGDTFQIGSETFELDLGTTLVAPTGARVAEGSTFTVNYGPGGVQTFEFDTDGNLADPANIGVEYARNWTAQEVAEAIHFAVRDNFVPPLLTADLTAEGNDTFADAVDSGLNGTNQEFQASGEIGDYTNVEPERDRDMVRLDLKIGSQLTARVDAQLIGSPLDAALRLFNERGQEVARADNSFGNIDPTLNYTAGIAGTYYLSVSGSPNLNYDPRFEGSGRDSQTLGVYDLNISVEDPANVTQIHENRVNFPSAIDFNIDPGTGIREEGELGTDTGIPVRLHSGLSATDVTEVVRQAMGTTFANGEIDTIKSYGSVIHVVGRSVFNPGPFGLTDFLPGDQYGNFNSNQRGQRNAFEGVYVDDVIIGFAERGEMVTAATGDTNFVANTDAPVISPGIFGSYYVEARMSQPFGLSGGGNILLTSSFDTNDRVTRGITVQAPPAYQIGEGQTFTLQDGVDTLVFEFDDVNIDDGVAPGHVEIDFDPQDFNFFAGTFEAQRDYEIAQAIRDAINQPSVQNPLNATANLADGAAGNNSTTNRINLNGNAVIELQAPAIEVVSTTSDPQTLIDAILGPGVTIGSTDPVYVGGPSSAGLFRGGGSSIGIERGIILSTGDARTAEGPNLSSRTSGFSSFEPDLDLDQSFAVRTRDTTSLDFTVNVEQDGELFFDFVFASEEYNESVGSRFSDVFAFYIDGENVGLIPGTIDPVSVNSVNGGNPFGSGGVNAQFYNNNDPNDGGTFLQQLGYDGFTDVFRASKQLTAGEHTIKLAISDVRDPFVDSAVFIQAFNASVDESRNTLPGEVFDLVGDSSRRRDQGQVIVHSNVIQNSLENGIVVDAGTRGPDGNPHTGPARLTRLENDRNLLPGVVLTNNLLTGNRQAGIRFSGDPSPAGTQVASVPFGRILNNTIVGTGLSDGIVVENNASPSVLNNLIARSLVGVNVDATSTTTVLGGTLYVANGTNASGIGVGSAPLFATDLEDIFVNPDQNNFYLASGSLAIDSSIDSLRDRAEMVELREPLGISRSPILAPDRDQTGQRRVDDPDVSTPTGLGQDVFKDRGALDRSDFAGPSAILINPRDNDAAGLDRDDRTTFVERAGTVFTDFSIQLIDGIQPSNQAQGTGPDDQLVVSDAVLISQDGTPLEDGIDYLFSYNATSNIVRLTPLAGIWEPDRAYEISLLNTDVFVIDAFDGGLIPDGTTFQLTDQEGTTETFEFDSGFGLQVPVTGGASLRDGMFFQIGDSGVTTRFEFDSNGATSQGGVAIPFTQSDSVAEVAAAITAAVASANIRNITPLDVGDGFVYLGGDTLHTLNTNGSTITQSGVPGVLAGNVPVPYIGNSNFTAAQVASRIATAINGNNGLFEVSAEARGADVFISGLSDLSGGVNRRFVNAISDLAGNQLQPNRFGGGTEFTIFLGAALDYGDAPVDYPVLKAESGAAHELIDGFYLGSGVTSEIDGQPSPNADADQFDDGVSFPAVMVAGFDSTLTVTAAGITAIQPGFLDAWIDFNGDGDFTDSNEKVFNGVELVNGANQLDFKVASMPPGGVTYARFRLSGSGGLSPTGRVAGGEVEDYVVNIEGNPWQNTTEPKDVNRDGFVTPLDALLVINYLNFNATGQPLPVPPTPDFRPPPFLDVSGDGFASPQDALIVINFLNSPGGQGEGEAGTYVALAEGEGGLPERLALASLEGELQTLPLADIRNGRPRVATSLDTSSRRDDGATDVHAEVPVGTDDDGDAFAYTDYRSLEFESMLDSIADDVEGALEEDLLDELFG